MAGNGRDIVIAYAAPKDGDKKAHDRWP